MSSSPHVMIPKPDELDSDLYRAIVEAGGPCLQHCAACGAYTHPPRYYCPKCSSGDFTFERVSGAATVYSYTVSHMSAEPAWQPYLPFVTIVAELAEGPRVVASARDITPQDVRIGMPVRVTTEGKSADFAIFWAEPTAS